MLVARRTSELNDARGEIVAAGGEAATLACDLANRDTIDDCAAKALRFFGAPDILVNAAGVNVRRPMLEVTRDDWDRVLKLNLETPFFLTQRLVPAMIERGFGRIINIASL